MSKRWDVLGVGCNSVDYVYRVPASPVADSPTAKQRINSHQRLCGGQTATALAACAGFGLRAAYLGAVGNDDNGRLINSELHRRGVDVSAVLTRDCANRFAVITVDEAGDRIVLWDRDDRLNLAAHEITAALVGAARLVHVDDEDENAAIVAGRLARQAGIPVTSDIDRVTDRTRELIDAVSVPIFAEHVLAEMSGERDPERALRSLRRTHSGLLCVTLGASGAGLLAGEEWIFERGVSVKAADTTGAGDVFRAGLIFGLLNNYAMRDMLRFANAAAAASCTRAGAMDGVPSLDAIGNLLRDA